MDGLIVIFTEYPTSRLQIVAKIYVFDELNLEF